MNYPYFSSIVESLGSVMENPDILCGITGFSDGESSDEESSDEESRHPGIYATGGLCNMPLPSLSLANAPDNILGLPISNSQAKLIIASAQAPFGQREETIVDTSVRRTWEWSPMQFSINNSQWEMQLQGLLNKVKDELGCDPDMTVTSEVSKLLLYI